MLLPSSTPTTGTSTATRTPLVLYPNGQVVYKTFSLHNLHIPFSHVLDTTCRYEALIW